MFKKIILSSVIVSSLAFADYVSHEEVKKAREVLPLVPASFDEKDATIEVKYPHKKKVRVSVLSLYKKNNREYRIALFQYNDQRIQNICNEYYGKDIFKCRYPFGPTNH